MICSFEGCTAKARGRGMCNVHYLRWYRSGNPAGVRPGAETRFWAKVDKNGPVAKNRPDLGCCWLWTAGGNGEGYGQLRVGSTRDGTRRFVYTHRFAYELLVGPIPADLPYLDHFACDTPACCNPAHLRPSTNAANTLRGMSAPAVNARKTHCKRNHEFTPENTMTTSRGHRECRTCRVEIHDRDRRR